MSIKRVAVAVVVGGEFDHDVGISISVLAEGERCNLTPLVKSPCYGIPRLLDVNIRGVVQKPEKNRNSGVRLRFKTLGDHSRVLGRI